MWNKIQIEADPRISNYNYGLRVKYSIEIAILEKQLICDYSTFSYEKIIYSMIDLEASFNR